MEKTINKKLLGLLAISILFVIGIAQLAYAQPESQSPSQKEFIFNGDFSLGNKGFITNYEYSQDLLSPEGYYTVTDNPNKIYWLFSPCRDHTTGRGNMMVVNGCTLPNFIVWAQEVKDIQPFNEYYISFWVCSVFEENTAILEVSVNGEVLKPNPIYLPWETCNWINVKYIWNSKENTKAFIKILDINRTAKGNDFAIDDISMKPVCNVVARAGKDIKVCEGENIVIGEEALQGFAPYQYNWYPSEGLSSDKVPQPVLTATKSTSYILIVTDSYGCVDIDTVNIEVIPKPPAEITSNKPTTICPCDNVTLSAPLGYYYLWTTGENSRSITVDKPGKYGVTILNKEGCYSYAETTVSFLDVETHIAIDSFSANVGEKIKIPIKISQRKNQIECSISNYSAKIRFNTSMLTPIGNRNLNSYYQDDQQIVEIQGNTFSETLSEIEFLVTLGNSTCTDISIDYFDWNCPNTKITTNNGKLCISNLCEQGGPRLFDGKTRFYLNQNYPNPASYETEIEYGIIEEGATKIEIYNLLGELQLSIENLDTKPGSYSIKINTNKLSSGLYIYSLITPNSRITKLMEIVH